MTVVMCPAMLASLSWVSVLARAANLGVVLPLMLVSIAIVIFIPVAASRGRLHIPAYVGIAILSFGVGLLLGRTAGMPGIARTSSGVILSVAFFLLMAAAVGSILALFCYRHPPDI